jgi:GT2 family glycosyltransferase/glycosyltransferase involved in cell wall biosynthesis
MEPNLPPVDIVIPFYKNAALVQPLFVSLEAVAPELTSADCALVAINDSPDDGELEIALAECVERAGKRFPCRIQRNSSNLGFVRSVNLALQTALKSRHDVLLLNSDTIVFPGAIAEVRRVAYLDPMTGFVSPRTNNATICSLPHQSEFAHQPPAEAHASWRELAKYLPGYHYAPTAVGFCLYIKSAILEEFGVFDEAYGHGYNEENDLIMRANRAGYRAALANHAFVYHIGESSFSTADTPKQLLEDKNARLLNERYPEYCTGITSYLESVHYEAEHMLAAMLPDGAGKLDLVFDFSSVGPYHNGTFEVAKRILKCAVKAWRDKFNIFVMASEQALHFHKLDQVPGALYVTPETSRVFAVAFRIGQPFSYEQLFRMSHAGVLNVYSMLDTIALDCLYLNKAELPVLWNSVMSHADGIIYISDFVGAQFARRFRLGPTVKELVAYLSLDLQDYVTPQDSPAGAGGHILVIGNAFQHKRMPATVEALSNAFPREKIIALGYNSDQRQNVIAYASGNLSEASMANLLRGAKFVVYPSTYEGFGIPVIESLACGRPVLARSIPVLRDIRRMIPARENLILYDSTTDLINRLNDGFPVWKPFQDSGVGKSLGWEAVTDRIGAFLNELTQNWSVYDNLLPRLEHMRLLQQPARTSQSVLPVSELHMALQDRKQRIADLESSLSWKITAPLRRICDVYTRFRRK